jgi:predicted transcriptional regulator
MKKTMSIEDQNRTLLELTAQIVSAHVAKNQIAAQGLPGLIGQVFNALKTAGQEPAPIVVEKQLPFVPAKRSIFPDYIICLEDGRKLKTLKRHLRSTFGLSPDQYREKWGLAPDYPMVAPNYAEHRSKLAKQLGLGRKSAGEEDEAPEAAIVEKPAPMAVPSPAIVAEEVDPAPNRRRAEPTAASVFAKFTAKATESPEVTSEPGPEPAAKHKRGRKPFSKQLARTMRQ